MNIMDYLEKELLYFDGGTGTVLQAMGLKPGEFPDRWSIEHPDKMVRLHQDYLEAGSNIINTNTFGTKSLEFEPGSKYSVAKIVKAAVANVRQAIANVQAKDGGKTPRFIALDIGPTGKLLKPMGDLAFEDAYNLFAEVVDAGTEAGADLIVIETMSDTYELKAAVLAAKEHSQLPVFTTMMFDEKARMLTGGDVPSAVAMLEGLGVDALGLNCGMGPAQMKPILEQVLRYSSLPVICKPNAGLPHKEGERTVYNVGADEFTDIMEGIAHLPGVSIIGGCCGTTPAYIKAMTERIGHFALSPVTDKNLTVVSSGTRAVFIGDDPVIIGERINPTGKPKFKEALRHKDLEYILKEGLKQQESGAHILDVNVGLPEINEPEMMTAVVKDLQSVIDLPLQIDTSDPKAMEQALRAYNGKALINSVSGKEAVMKSVFPLAKKYGGVIVALALDDVGIPETAEGRIAVAQKIYRKAAEYGIAKKDILIDGLTMTISANPSAARTTLETIRRVRDDLKGKSVLGVSNVSFGLPQREIINAEFFSEAILNGLNAAIINPNNEAMMRTYYAYRALSGKDVNCAQFIERYANMQSSIAVTPVQTAVKENPGAATPTALTLADSIRKGLKDSAGLLAAEQLKTRQPLDIINQDLIPALDVVGKGFEKGTIFLPQLLMSADAAKAAFEVIKGQMTITGQKQEKKGKVILATVKGDIHDIGKNIVKVLLENYDYDVIDLGKDVPPEVILEKAREENVKLVGLSALMTTTVPSMEETIKLIRKELPDCKVIVGGAVMTKMYADMIGADAYCKDAMSGVNEAEKLIGKKE